MCYSFCSLLTGYSPFNSDNIRIVYLKSCVADFGFPSFLSPSVKRLIRRTLDPNPATRITVADILKDEWFNSNNGDQPTMSSQEAVSSNTVLARRKRSFRTSFRRSKIMTAIENPIKCMGLYAKKIDVLLEGGVGPTHEFLSITPGLLYPYLYLVEIRKDCGDARDFDKFYRELTDAVKEIILNEDRIYLPRLED